MRIYIHVQVLSKSTSARQFTIPNLTKISIPLNLIFFLFLFLFGFDSSSLKTEAMKVHPMQKKRNIAIRDAMDSLSPSSSSGETQTLTHKRLRRLPHVFGKVLELPFPSDADVSVEESTDCFRFVAEADDAVIGDGVRVHAVEIHPGVTKIVVRNGGEGSDGEELELLLGEVDVWRFRLPAMTQPELATVVFVDGELTVTVPKSGEVVREVMGVIGQLVLVQ